MNLHSDKIRQLRLSTGKSEGEMAEIMNISVESYFDLEAYDDEVLECISVYELRKMSGAFGVTPVELLMGVPRAEANLNHISYVELVERIKKYIDSQGVTVTEFEDSVGWYIESLFDNPQEIEGRCVQFLIDACNELQLDWLEVIPNEAA